MSDIAIRVESLSKQYRIGPSWERCDTLSEQISRFLAALFRRPATPQPNEERRGLIWALKDISFDVPQGEVLGIIGRNGAGKSTLLKILCRITEPSEGKAEIYGRVGSLLEVGIGFHPELTGRENIFLNGAILGMRRKEIEIKFDEIVAFSELEEFLETPIKHYSTGMYMRLAFAVAAHLDPEILLVDEVLAVGDLAFQKRCLGKMNEMGRSGKTVLFVSHNLAAIAGLCTKGIFLEQGRIRSHGPIQAVISEYISMGLSHSGEMRWEDVDKAPGNPIVRIKAVRIVSEGKVTSEVKITQDVFIEMEFWNLRPGTYIAAGIQLLDKIKVVVLASANMPSVCLNHDPWAGKAYPLGIFKSICKIPANFLNEGLYSVTALIITENQTVQVQLDEIVSFTVHEMGEMRKEWMGHWWGVVRPKLEWHTELQEEGV